MSMHPSLRSTSKMRRHRSVLSRLERLKILHARGMWQETQSPLGLPKVKNLKVTVKKEKAAAPAAGEVVPGAPAPIAGAAASGAAKAPATKASTAKAPAAKPDAAAKPKKGA